MLLRGAQLLGGAPALPPPCAVPSVRTGKGRVPLVQCGRKGLGSLLSLKVAGRAWCLGALRRGPIMTSFGWAWGAGLGSEGCEVGRDEAGACFIFSMRRGFAVVFNMVAYTENVREYPVSHPPGGLPPIGLPRSPQALSVGGLWAAPIMPMTRSRARTHPGDSGVGRSDRGSEVGGSPPIMNPRRPRSISSL